MGFSNVGPGVFHGDGVGVLSSVRQLCVAGVYYDSNRHTGCDQGKTQARRRKRNLRSRSIEWVWKGMGCAIMLYILSGVVSHHMNGPAFWAALLFFVGLAHGISAMILRWGMQGLAAAIWCAGGIATFFFTRQSEGVGIFLAATFFGQILFGLYVMMLDRRRTAASVPHHA
jgi:hypothetical protein